MVVCYDERSLGLSQFLFYLSSHSQSFCLFTISSSLALSLCRSFLSYLFLPSPLCFCQSLLCVIFYSLSRSISPSRLSLLLSVRSKKFSFREALSKKKIHCFDKCFKSKLVFIALRQIIDEECLFASTSPIHTDSLWYENITARCRTPRSSTN